MDARVATNRIAEAFADAAPPASLVSHECPECERVQTALGGLTWSKVSSEAVKEHRDSLPLLTPEAYVSLIPAYLTVAVSEPLGEVARAVLHSLQPSGNRGGCPFHEEQRRVLLDVAEWLAEQESWGINLSRMRRYWSW